jgi:hypothetical protein
MDTTQTPALKFSRAIRNAVCKTSDGGPNLQTWLDRVRALDVPALTEAIEGIWCGRTGTTRIDLKGSKSRLCVGWYEGKVEWTYIS